MSTRLSLIKNHLQSRFPPLSTDPSLENWRSRSAQLNPQALFEGYYGKYHSYIRSMRNNLESSPLFNYHNDLNLSLDEIRGKVFDQLGSVIESFPITPEEDEKNGAKKIKFLTAVNEYDLSPSTKATVHLCLYLDSILNFGTEKHRKYIERCYKFQDFCCFGMTELGHGSNVSGIETVATFIKETREFEINTPVATAAKWWIGGAAKTANMCIVLAQLVVEGKNQGVHMFVVPIRDENNNEIPGVSVGDCGPKISVDGIDNGYIIFTKYRVPYDALLDKLSQIAPNGHFKSSIKNKEKRLGTMLGTMIRGRITVVLGSSTGILSAVTIALRYSAVRKQFAPDNKTEVPILSYQNHKCRLIPVLANAFAVKSALLHLTESYEKNCKAFARNPEGEELGEFHCILSGYKSVCSWYALVGIQICRECCGGLGYSAYSGLGRLRDNQEIHTTWEGDNSVLIQQTAKYITKQIQHAMKGKEIYSSTLKFLKFEVDHSKKGPLGEVPQFYHAMEHLVNFHLNESLLKMQELTTTGLGMTDVWNNCQYSYMQDLAKAYTELQIMKAFEELVKNIREKDERSGVVIGKLHRLYCITVLERNIPVLIELGYDPSIRRAFKNEIISLSSELAEVSVNIVDALAPSDKVMSSPLGSSDGQVYSKMIQLVESNLDTYKTSSWNSKIVRFRNRNI